MKMLSISIFLIEVLFLVFGLSFLQVHLSKKKAPNPGMILPIIFLVLASLSTLVSAFNTYSTRNFGEYLAGIISSFIFKNMPTIIFLVIYTACRKNLKSKKEIEKMNIIDLD